MQTLYYFHHHHDSLSYEAKIKLFNSRNDFRTKQIYIKSKLKLEYQHQVKFLYFALELGFESRHYQLLELKFFNTIENVSWVRETNKTNNLFDIYSLILLDFFKWPKNNSRHQALQYFPLPQMKICLLFHINF